MYSLALVLQRAALAVDSSLEHQLADERAIAQAHGLKMRLLIPRREIWVAAADAKAGRTVTSEAH